LSKFLEVLSLRSMSTGTIARRLKCHIITALRYLRELKKAKKVIEKRISNTINLWKLTRTVLHQLDPKIIYPHYDFKHLTEQYFEIGMKLDDFLIQLVKYCRKRILLVDVDSKSPNFALMMISTYHKVKGDNVVLIYGSKIDLRYEFSSLDWLHWLPTIKFVSVNNQVMKMSPW